MPSASLKPAGTLTYVHHRPLAGIAAPSARRWPSAEQLWILFACKLAINIAAHYCAGPFISVIDWLNAHRSAD
jgi:hypothetical protein